MAVEEQSSAEDRETVTATLLRLGFLSGEGEPEEEAIVEAISTILPHEPDIGVCVSYSDFSSTQAHPFEERTCSLLRVRSASHSAWHSPAMSAAVPKMQIALCTDQLLLWTSSQVKSIGAALEEKVSAQVLSLSEVLGAALAGKHGNVVHVWVDQGPTLAFHTEPASAQALQAYVETVTS
jgi:hypothetical protein